jgi:hypothetical protein
MEAGKLILQTDDTSEITVDRQKVDRLVADGQVKVALSDGTTLEGVTRESPER